MTDDEAATGATGGVCPQCGGAPTKIVYGYPTYETFEAAERGEVLLGGCMVWDGRPSSQCSQCGAEFGRRPPRRLGRGPSDLGA